jgi:hypothetical protein
MKEPINAINDLKQKTLKRVEDLLAAISEESMRGKVLVMTGQIDNLLSEMLKLFLKPARDKNDELLNPMRPLGSFASRVDIAYRLGLIRESDADALDLLRKIRNDCAHTTTPFSIEVEPHSARFIEFTARTCEKDYLYLAIGGVICPKTTEDWFIMVCLSHIVYMEATLEKLEQTPNRFAVTGNQKT